jgi:hypothetical protein
MRHGVSHETRVSETKTRGHVRAVRVDVESMRGHDSGSHDAHDTAHDTGSGLASCQIIYFVRMCKGCGARKARSKARGQVSYSKAQRQRHGVRSRIVPTYCLVRAYKGEGASNLLINKTKSKDVISMCAGHFRLKV